LHHISRSPVSFYIVLFLILSLSTTVKAQSPAPDLTPSVNSAAPRAYVVSSSEKYTKTDKNLFIIDVQSALSNPGRAVTTLVPVYARFFVFSSDGHYCVSGNDRDPWLSVIDTGKAALSPTEAVIHKITLQSPPSAMAVSQGKPLLFVAENSGKILEIIDLEKTLKNPGSLAPFSRVLKYPALSLHVSPDNRYLVIREKKIHILEIARIFSDPEGAELSAVTPEFPPSSLLFDEKGRYLFSSDLSRIVLSLYDFQRLILEPRKAELTRGRAHVASEERIITREENLQENMAFFPGKPYLFMVHPALDRLTVIDTEKATAREGAWGVSRIPAGRFPLHTAFTSNGEYALVNNALSGNLYIYDSEKAINEPEHALIGKTAIPAPTFFSIKPEGHQ